MKSRAAVVTVLVAITLGFAGYYLLFPSREIKAAAQALTFLDEAAAKRDPQALARVIGAYLSEDARVTLELTLPARPGAAPRVFSRREFGREDFIQFVQQMVFSFTPERRQLHSRADFAQKGPDGFVIVTSHDGEGSGTASAFGSGAHMAFRLKGACKGPVRFTQAGRNLTPKWKGLECRLEVNSVR